MNALLDRFRPDGATEGRSLGTYLLLIGAGFVALWLLLQFVPAATPPPVVSDDAGTVAVTPAADEDAFSLLTPGRMAVIVLLMAGGAWAIYLHRRSDGGTAANAPMHPMGRLALSQNQHLQLVHCNGEVLLLGVGAEEVTLLKSYPREDFAAALDAASDADAPPTLASGDGGLASTPPEAARFADVLRKYAQFTAQ